MAYDKYAYQNKQIEMYRKALLDAQEKIKELENRIQVVARLNNVTIDDAGNVKQPGAASQKYGQTRSMIYDDFVDRMKYGYAKQLAEVRAAMVHPE